MPKFRRLQLLQELLFYISREYTGDPELDQKEPRAQMAALDPDLDLDTLPHAYTNTVGWQTFVSPLPTHSSQYSQLHSCLAERYKSHCGRPYTFRECRANFILDLEVKDLPGGVLEFIIGKDEQQQRKNESFETSRDVMFGIVLPLAAGWLYFEMLVTFSISQAGAAAGACSVTC